jgi:hypothetical protein
MLSRRPASMFHERYIAETGAIRRGETLCVPQEGQADVKKIIILTSALATASLAIALGGRVRADDDFEFQPGTLLLSRSVYAGNSNTVNVGQTLPPGCVPGTVNVPLIAGGTTPVTIPNNSSSGCTKAVADGTYPTVFNNNSNNGKSVDGSFGVTSPIFLDNITTDGRWLSTLPIPSSQIVTSFSSKSELALNLSLDRRSVTFMGYRGGPAFATGPNQLDVSNSNTPGVVDPTNPVVSQFYRSVAEVDAHGHLQITEGNAYSGNNGRAAIKAGSSYYMTGNDNNGGLSKTQLTTTQVGVNLVNSTGVELLFPFQVPSLPPNINKIGDFEVTQVGYATADKPGKDNNFRGLTIFHDTLYVTKGSGGNGINTVYQVGTAGTLPTLLNAPGGNLLNVPITVLPGFPTGLASGVDQQGNPAAVSFPFGIWFADSKTLYVGDEGDGTLVSPPVNGNVADAASQATAGLQKWILDEATHTWHLAYILQNGLNIGVPYTVPTPSGATPYPSAAPGGLRNITGRVNGDGTVDLWAITSTLSTSGDQGADPNQLVFIRDHLKNTDPAHAAHEQFKILRTATYGEVLRGVSLTPGSCEHDRDGGDGDSWTRDDCRGF